MTLPDLLARRLDIVSRMCLATSELQKIRQVRAAADMDAMRCEMALAHESTDAVARELLDARQRLDDSDRGLDECEARIAALEEALAEADREIAEIAR